jgi:HEAT repeat protein
MSKKQGLLAFILIAGALALLLWIAQQPREPVYQGRQLSSWLKDLENWDGDTNNAAFVAFREMGTNAIPPLLEVIESDGSPIQRMIMKFNKRQSVVKLPFGTPWVKTMTAAWGLYAMGTNAEPALPVLTNLLFHTNAVIASATVLAGIGSAGVPSLLAALTNRDYLIRFSAASGLGWEHADFEVVVPALIASLQDNNRQVKLVATDSLGQLHVKPELAVPALINAFTNSDALLRSSVLISLGQFEARAKDSIPMVMTALKDSDKSVRTSAGFAIKQIDPEAAEKAGVQ